MIFYIKIMNGTFFSKNSAWSVFVFCLLGLSGLLCFPWHVQAQQPTAVINSLGGEVMVSIQRGALVPGMVGNVLRTGDEIRTHAGAVVGLYFSEGSQLELGENTNISLTALAEAPLSGNRTSHLDLWRGRARLKLLPETQPSETSFRIQTHNSLVATLSAESDTEIVYDPNTNKTTVIVHKAEVVVTNLLTGISTRIPEGHSSIIRDRVIQEIARIVELPSIIEMRQPTAIMSEIQNQVLVSIQGESPTPGIQEMVLRTGDVISTGADSTCLLTLSEGSEISLDEKTNITLTALVEDSQTGARITRCELWQGTLRAILTADHQKPGSSFTVQTPNALIGVTAAEPESEVIYDPDSHVTIVNAHKAEAVITNLLTGSSKVIPQGHSGIIHQRIMQELARIVESPQEISTFQTGSVEVSPDQLQEPEATPEEADKKSGN